MNILSSLFSSIIASILVTLFEGVFLFAILMPVIDRLTRRIGRIIYHNLMVRRYRYFNYYDGSNWVERDTIFTPTERTMLKYGVVDEELFLKRQKNIPYFMYALIQLVLVIGLVILIIISKTYKIDIDYKTSLIIGILGFFFICIFASTILWFSVFAQTYKLDINKKLFKSFTDTYINL